MAIEAVAAVEAVVEAEAVGCGGSMIMGSGDGGLRSSVSGSSRMGLAWPLAKTGWFIRAPIKRLRGSDLGF